jgi:hypothetical protein
MVLIKFSPYSISHMLKAGGTPQGSAQNRREDLLCFQAALCFYEFSEFSQDILVWFVYALG